MWLPSAENVSEIHFELAKIFEQERDPISPCGIKSLELLESACARPHVGIGNIEKYNSVDLKIAALFHSLTKNHPFYNGNKRTALVSMLSALYRNDRKFIQDVTDDVIYDFVVRVTANEFPHSEHGFDTDEVVRHIAIWLRKYTQSVQSAPSAMAAKIFAEKCEQAGANVKDDGVRYKINFNGNGIRFKKTKRKLPAPVIKNYLSKLKLGESYSGFDMEEFSRGVSSERDQMYRFMIALRSLAKT